MDLMSMDFFMWNILKNKIYHTLLENAEILKNRIRNACAEITSLMMSRERKFHASELLYRRRWWLY